MTDTQMALNGNSNETDLWPCLQEDAGANQPLAPTAAAEPAVDPRAGRWDHARCADCGEYKQLRKKDVPWPDDKVMRCCEVPYLRRRCGQETKKRALQDEVLEGARKRMALEQEKAVAKAKKVGGTVTVRSEDDPSQVETVEYYGDPLHRVKEAEQKRLLKELTDFEAKIGRTGLALQPPICWCASCGKPSRLRQGAHAWPEDKPFLCISAGGDDCRPAHNRTGVPCYMECRTIGCHKHVVVPKDKDPWRPHLPFYCLDAGRKCSVANASVYVL
jgi:hypothetical protein